MSAPRGGLAGLIADINALSIADGVILLPLAAPVLDQIVEDALPLLRAMEVHPARRSHVLGLS